MSGTQPVVYPIHPHVGRSSTLRIERIRRDTATASHGVDHATCDTHVIDVYPGASASTACLVHMQLYACDG